MEIPPLFWNEIAFDNALQNRPRFLTRGLGFSKRRNVAWVELSVNCLQKVLLERPMSSSASPSSASPFEAVREEVRAKTTLSTLIGEDVRLQRKGAVFMGLCPFHKEKTPSFKVDDRQGTYHCFGCNTGGDAFSYVMERRHCTFMEALTFLAERVGVPVPSFGHRPEDHGGPQTVERRHRLLDLHQSMADYCAHCLQTSPQAEAARQYLARRQISETMVKAFRLGYDDGSVARYLLGRGAAPNTLVEAGLAVVRDDSPSSVTSLRDRFVGRITFPIFDIHNRPIAFGGRILLDKAKAPKYLNSSETPLFHKGRHLFNLNAAIQAQATPLVLVEGYMDVVSLVGHGFPQAIASLGTALTEDQITLLWKYDDHPILCFDGDSAGLKASARAVFRALPLLRPGKSLFFCYLPDGLDPDDFIKAQGAEAFRGLLKEALPLVDVLWKSCAEPYETKNAERTQWIPEDRAAFKNDLMEAVKTIPDTDIQSSYRSLLMRRFYARRSEEVYPSAVWRSNKGKTADFPKKLHPSTFNVKNIVAQKVLLGILLIKPSLLDEVDELLARVPFSDVRLEAAKDELLERCFDDLNPAVPLTKKNEALQAIGLGTLRTHAPFLFQTATDAQILRRWKEIWFYTVGYGQMKGDLRRLGEQIKRDLNEKAWEQLKALFFGSETLSSPESEEEA